MDSLEQKSRGFVLGLAGELVVKSMLMENDVEFVSKGRQARRRSKVEGFLDEEAKRFGEGVDTRILRS